MPIFTDNNGKRSPTRVAIVAFGVISPLGPALEPTRTALQTAKDCVGAISSFPTEHCRCTTAGQIPDSWLDPGEGKPAKRLHRASRMMIKALSELREQDRHFQPELTVIGTTSGGMSFGQDYYRALQQQQSQRHAPGWIANYPPQKPVIDALAAFHISSSIQVIANACASGTNALGHAFECVRSGLYSRVLAGGYDAISELVFVGFDSLQAATPDKCRPFDRGRTGMVLGEGAALFALENLESAQARGANIVAEIVGYGISTDNHHLTQPDPSGSGPLAAMRRALDDAGLSPSGIDYINAHGTATVFNDAAEGKAIADLFGTRVPVSSTKSQMGHSLGAAGAIEAAFCILALTGGFLPANINFRASDEALDLDIVANASRAREINTALSNSFGFGGTNASIILRRWRA